MNKIEELIQQYCPDGVEYKTLGELGSFYGGLSGKTKEDFKDGNAKFISYKNIYSNPSLNINTDERVKIAEGEKQHIIQYGDILFTGSSETPDECGMSSVLTIHTDEKLYLNSFCFGFRLNDLSLFYPDFLKHLFRSSELRSQIGKTASGTTRFNVSKARFAKVSIPVPPLPVQEEIVRILDNFTTLEAELEAELEARQQQYQYYRDNLLSFEGRTDVEWKKLGEIAELGTGSHNTQDGLSEGRYPFYTRGSEILFLNDYDFDETAIITAGDGAGVGKVFHFVQGKYSLHQRAYRIVPDEKQVLARFVYYYIGATFYNYIMRSSVSSSVVSIRKPMMVNYPIPIPSLAEQQKIVSILDRFDTLVNDISQGLPAEIAARKKQYEYYRDKLLTFKRKEA